MLCCNRLRIRSCVGKRRNQWHCWSSWHHRYKPGIWRFGRGGFEVGDLFRWRDHEGSTCQVVGQCTRSRGYEPRRDTWSAMLSESRIAAEVSAHFGDMLAGSQESAEVEDVDMTELTPDHA